MTLKLSEGLRNKLLGINLTKVTNGTFETDTTGWAGTSATLALTGGGDGANSTTDSLTVTGSGAAGYAEETFTLRNGNTYYFSAYHKDGTSANGQIEIGTSAGAADLYDSGTLNDASWTKYETWFMVPGTLGSTTTVYVSLNTASDANTELYDEVVLRNAGKSVQDIFNGGQIEIYTATQPTSADDAPTGTKLITIDNSGVGLTFDDATGGVLSKAAGETWTGTCVATGQAGWARLLLTNDGAGSSTTDERMDMAISTSGSQLNFSSTAFTEDATQTITSFTVTLSES